MDVKAAAGTTETPDGCLVLDTDKEWPPEEEWRVAMPNIKARKGPGQPDYHLSVKTVAEIQAAVKFVAEHKIRISIINSGHDFQARHFLSLF